MWKESRENTSKINKKIIKGNSTGNTNKSGNMKQIESYENCQNENVAY